MISLRSIARPVRPRGVGTHLVASCSLACLFAATPQSASAQRLPAGFSSSSSQVLSWSPVSHWRSAPVLRDTTHQRQVERDRTGAPRSPAVLFVGGVVGAGLGTGAGIASGSWEVLAVTEPTLMPLGVHLANRRQGSYPLDLLASVSSLAVLFLVEGEVGQTTPAHSGGDSDRFWIAASAVQLITVVVVERATAKRRARLE